jgi:hypothetical protein
LQLSDFDKGISYLKIAIISYSCFWKKKKKNIQCLRLQPQDLEEFIPLVNQLISRFKQSITPFLIELLVPFVQAIFSLLNMVI